MKCPKCKGKTEVLETIQKDAATRRRRRCIGPVCGFRFTTVEAANDPSQRRAPNAAALVAKLIAPEFKGSGKYDPEALAAAIAVDERKLVIRRAQRARAQLERDAWIETGFERAPDTLDERTLRRELEGF